MDKPKLNRSTPLHRGREIINLIFLFLKARKFKLFFFNTEHSVSLPGVQEKLGVMNKGLVYALWDYTAQQADELSFSEGDALTVLRRRDDTETEWWWARLNNHEGYVPRNLLGVRKHKTLEQQTSFHKCVHLQSLVHFNVLHKSWTNQTVLLTSPSLTINKQSIHTSPCS